METKKIANLEEKNSDTMTKIYPVLKEIFPSEEMASFLAKSSLAEWQIAGSILGAPISLKRKRELFLLLASEKETSYFQRQADNVLLAIQTMQPKPGEFFYLKICYYDESAEPPLEVEEGLEPYLTWEHIIERIQQRLGYLEEEERELTWFEVEKWSPDGTGRLKNVYDYTVLGTEVCYVECGDRSACPWDWIEFSVEPIVARDLLPVPFRAGDIITADCRPFVPVSHAVILEIGDNCDCCCLQALFCTGDGAWEIGAVKHGHVFPNHYKPMLSPLYRLDSFHGQLPKEEQLLEKVSQYLSGDESRGAALWNYIYHLQVENHEQRVTDEQILSYIENGGEI